MLRNRYLGLVCGSMLALAACGGPTNNTDGGTGSETSNPTDGGTGNETGMGGMPVDRYFVVNNLIVQDSPDTAFAMGSQGFNLDNLYTQGGGSSSGPGCGKEDYYSTLDLDQNCSMVNAMDMCTGMTGATIRYDATNMAQTGGHGGVDNQLPNLGQTLSAIASGMNLSTLLQNYVSTNQIALVVRVTAPTGLTDSQNVTVRIYQAYPTFTSGCSTVEANRTYAISSSSVMGGNLDMANLTFQGTIVGGRLRVASMNSLNIPLPPIMGVTIPLSLSNPQLRVSFNADGTMGMNGNLGGAVPAQGILDAVRNNPMLAQYRTIVESAIGGIVDVQTNGICVQRMNNMVTQIGSIGMGIGVTMLPAMVQPMPAASQTAGTCGASGGGGG